MLCVPSTVRTGAGTLSRIFGSRWYSEAGQFSILRGPYTVTPRTGRAVATTCGRVARSHRDAVDIGDRGGRHVHLIVVAPAARPARLGDGEAGRDC